MGQKVYELSLRQHRATIEYYLKVVQLTCISTETLVYMTHTKKPEHVTP